MAKISWDTFEKEIAQLAELIHPPVDVIVGIVRGGMVPARLLASKLKVSDVYCLSVRKSDGERIFTTKILDDLSGKSVLLVEDMLESGKSLWVTKEYLESLGATVKTAALYTMHDTKYPADFSLRKISAVPEFPWE